MGSECVRFNFREVRASDAVSAETVGSLDAAPDSRNAAVAGPVEEEEGGGGRTTRPSLSRKWQCHEEMQRAAYSRHFERGDKYFLDSHPPSSSRIRKEKK